MSCTLLPRRLLDAWDLAVVRQLSKADAAKSEIAHEGALAAATETAIDRPRRKLRSTLTAGDGR